MSSMMTSERPKRRSSVTRKSERRIRSTKKSARPELCKKEDWSDWTKEAYADKDFYELIEKVSGIIIKINLS